MLNTHQAVARSVAALVHGDAARVGVVCGGGGGAAEGALRAVATPAFVGAIQTVLMPVTHFERLPKQHNVRNPFKPIHRVALTMMQKPW